MKCSLLLLVFPVLLSAGFKGEVAEKRISREFKIQTNGYLSIDNKYGSIDVAIGTANKIEIEVIMTVESSSKKKSQEALDRIDVAFEEGMNSVKASTTIDSKSGWSSWFDSGKVEMQINYQVLVPADIYLELYNKYGNIYVQTTNRDLKIELKYGDIRLGDIQGNLALNMAYSEGTISRFRNGKLTLSYSELAMEDAGQLDLDMKYTDLVMGSATRLNLLSAYSDIKGKDIDELKYSGKYDDVFAERVKVIEAESGYSGITIEGLSQTGNFDMRYGDLEVRGISRSFTQLNVKTAYTDVDLGFSEGTSFSIDVNNNYGDIEHRGLKVTEDIQRSSNSVLKATRGSGGGQVTVRMNYGELNIH